MAVHVRDGTPQFGPPLCESCVQAHIERGYRESEKVIFCQATWPEHRVQFRVRECSGYVDAKRQDLEQMERMAWILLPQEGKRVRGFISPREMPDDGPQVEIELDKSE